MNFKLVGKIIGRIMILEGILMILPLIVSIIYQETINHIIAFCVPIVFLIVLGHILQSIKPTRTKLYQKEGFALCALVWIVMTIFGAIPFLISGDIKNVFNAMFETMSGFTTTGASILDGVEEFGVTELAKSSLFWRSFTHWIGGMGILVFILIFIPESDDGSSLHLLKAESPGPQVGKITSKMRVTSRILYLIYLGMTLLEVVILLFDPGHTVMIDGQAVTFKLNLFESFLATFGSAGTGGFGFAINSFEYFTPYVQYVIATFLVLFGINFTVYYLILIGKFKEAIKNDELITYLLIIISSIAIIVGSSIHQRIVTLQQVNPAVFEEIFRHSFFQVASIITTTGYSSVNYENWQPIAKTVIIILMFCGAMAGSTAGGIKLSRIVIIFKGIKIKLKKLINPRSVTKVRVDGKILEEETIDDVFTFVSLYAVILLIVTLVLGFDPSNGQIYNVSGNYFEHGFLSNFTATLSCLSNIGPGFEVVGPYGSFAIYNNASTLLLTFVMLIGRLEILPVLILFHPQTWRK